MAIHESAATGFASGSDAYERGPAGLRRRGRRFPAPPSRLAPGVRLLELGAGTGKLTRLLAPLGPEILVVEPVEDMRDRLPSTVPQAERVGGTPRPSSCRTRAWTRSSPRRRSTGSTARARCARCPRPAAGRAGRPGLEPPRRVRGLGRAAERPVRAAALGHPGLRPGPLARAVRDTTRSARSSTTASRTSRAHAGGRRRPGRLDLVRGHAARRAAGRRARQVRALWPRTRHRGP